MYVRLLRLAVHGRPVLPLGPGARSGAWARIPRAGPLAGATVVLLLLAAVANLGLGSSVGAAAVGGRAMAPLVSNYTLNGTVDGYSESNVTSPATPIPDDTVNVLPSSCPPYVNVPGACAPTATTRTNSSGDYSFSLPNGTYDLYSSPEGVYGGDSTIVTVDGASVTAPAMHSFFELSYSNTTYVLPDFTSLAGYIDDLAGTQVPVLSYASDGVFYIDSSNDLVFYSFPNRTVDRIAPWKMLYDQVGYEGELNNYLYLTFDGSYAYELGCAVAGCSNGSALIVYAVNITTGRSFTWDTGISKASTSANAQVNLVGRNGNDSLMALVTSDATIHLYDPWNATTWNAGRFAYFEANNAYWVPFLNSYINVEAEGSSSDELEQLELEGPGSGTTFVRVFGPVVNGPGGVTSNGVNGLAFDLTRNEMAYDYGSSASGSVATVYSLADGVLSRMVAYGVDRVPYGQFVADDHRLSVTTGSPIVNGYYDPDFYNQSWVTNPFTGQYFDTNIQEGYRNPSAPREFDAASGFNGEPAHQFLNASNAITAYSVDCADSSGAEIPCPLLGTTPGTTLGTIYYVSQLPEDRFPYPASAPIAQSAPPAPLHLSETSGPSSVTVTWGAPSLYPVLNFTLYWGGNATALTHHVNLASDLSEFTLSGLLPQETVDYGVSVTDLNDVSPLATGAAVPLPSAGPGAPTGLTLTGGGTDALNLSWTNPPGTLTNDTVYYATDPSGPFTAVSAGVASSSTVGGLSPGTEYYLEVAAWDLSGESPASNEVPGTTLGPPSAPGDLAVIGGTSTSVSLSWMNPPSLLVNDTVYSATSAGGPFRAVSAGVTTSATVGGLSPLTKYYFGVAAWDPTARSSMSGEVSATTFGLPLAPNMLRVTGVGPTSVSLSWQNPSGILVNDTVYYASDPDGPFLASSHGVSGSATLGGLVPETEYFLEVSAWSFAGESPRSPEVNVTTPVAAPAAPTGLVASVVNETVVELSWTPPAGPLQNYTVAVRNASGVSAVYEDIANGSASTYLVTGLTPSTTYYFLLWAWTSGGAGNVSGLASVTTASPPGGGGSGFAGSGEPLWLFLLPLAVVALVLVLVLTVRRRRSPPRKEGP